MTQLCKAIKNNDKETTANLVRKFKNAGFQEKLKDTVRMDADAKFDQE